MEKYENINDVIAENLIYYRKKAGLTQQELALKLNYSDKSISKWERGEGVPDIHVLVALAKEYGLSVNDFVSTTKKTKIAKFYFSRVFITIISVLLVWLIATVAFFVTMLIVGKESLFKPWLVFIYAIPVSALVATIFFDIFFSKILNIFSVSILCWGMALSIYLTVPNIQHMNLIFIVVVPIQLIVILFYILIYRKERAKKK